MAVKRKGINDFGLPAPRFNPKMLALYGVAGALFVGLNAVVPGAGVYLALAAALGLALRTSVLYWAANQVRWLADTVVEGAGL